VETKVKENGTAKTAANNTTKSGNGLNNNKMPVSTAFNDPAKKDEAKAGEAKTEPAKSTPAAEPAKAEPAKAEAATPAQEPSKKEIKENFAVQQARKLEETEKIVEQLGKKIAQKKKLHTTIGNLDEFVLAQNDDDDMASDSRFSRCELAITDDNGKEFVTRNPYIIAYVAHEVKQLCIDKLAEVEATIVIP